jgi:hypothetical protein
MADLGYNPMKMELEHLKRDLDEARRINQTHQMMNGKLHLEINNLKFNEKKLKNRVIELEKIIKEKETNESNNTQDKDETIN